MNQVYRKIVSILAGGMVILAATTGQAQSANITESACMVAVNNKYGGKVRHLDVVRSEFSQANSEVILDADGERWRCLVSNDGHVEDLSRQGKSQGHQNSGSPSTSAESNCMQAVNSKYHGHVRNIEVTDSKQKDDGYVLRLTADGEQWKCKVNKNGDVRELERDKHNDSSHDSGSNSGDDTWYSRLVGAADDGAENQLRLNGFRQVDSFDSGRHGNGTIWYNHSTRQCLQMITVNGRVDSAVDIHSHDACH